MNLQQQVSLQGMNTLGIAVGARYFLHADTLAAAEQGLDWARRNRQPVLVLGEGSNLLLSRDWNGLVLRMAVQGLQAESREGETVRVQVAGGHNWHDCVARTVAEGWFGLENLALIPGTAGAAPVQNIGAYGIEISSLLESVDVISIADGQSARLAAADCRLAYRNSIFRGQLPNRWLITGIRLRLSCRARPHTAYPALAGQLRAQGIDPAAASPAQVMAAVMAVRRAKLPDPATLPNAGSFFKNPVVPDAQYRALQRQYPDLVAHAVGADWKLAAGWLVEQAGFRGLVDAGVGTAATQALVLINPGRRDGPAVLAFAERIQAAVRERFGVALEIEPLVV